MYKLDVCRQLKQYVAWLLTFEEGQEGGSKQVQLAPVPQCLQVS